ncbi:MAG TPA: tripartite tricarboxylate transporter TctB family protein [Hyphomicrobiaceae bacterium]|nr:tripartite tricarboxylate transporter TctB family protein [Hyphomicrobiaceae bacterium]
MHKNVAWQETVLGLFVIALAAVVGWQTMVIPENAIYAKIGPRFFPWIATALLVVMGVLLTVQGLQGGWEHELDDDPDLLAVGWLAGGLVFNVLFIGGAFGLPRLGFILCSTVLFTCVARAFGSRQPVRDAAIGFLLALVCYVGFDRVLGYKIGSGPIEGLI